MTKFTTKRITSIGDLWVKTELFILNDEAYERIHFTPSFIRITALNDEIATNILTVGSIYELFNATERRLGFTVGPQHHDIEAIHYAYALLC